MNTGGTQFRFTVPGGYIPFSGLGVDGSPLTPPSGSPPFAGNEFWFPPYPSGSISNGDVFVIYDVVETKTLNIITRPNQFYGSPIWGSPFGSPRPGSPKFNPPGSPATYPSFGSPPSVGNTITIKAPSTAEFIYGKEVQIRNASEPTINRDYNVYSAIDLGGSPNLVQLIVLDPVLADTTNDGELVLAPIGWSGGSFCSDVPPELSQLHFIETYQPEWRFAGSPDTGLEPAFQYFILAANSTNDTVEVQGDIRSLLSNSNFVSSPIAINAIIQHSVNPGSPTTLNNNNGAVVISSITYNVETNKSTLFLDTVTDDYPTGWIVPGA
jgi:hypothetical protein